jgi:hypothetical protein
LSGGASVTHPIDPHWPGNVLDLLLAQILKTRAAGRARGRGPYWGQIPPGIGQGFDPCGDVNAVAIEVVAFDDHVAEIDADAQLDPAGRRDTSIPPGHCLRHRDHAAHRIDDAHKFHQHAVAGGLDDAAMMFADFPIEELAAQRFEAFERALLVRSHQPRIPRHIGGKDRGETSARSHPLHPALRSPSSRWAWSTDRYHGGRPRTDMSNAAVATAIGFSSVTFASSVRPNCPSAAGRKRVGLRPRRERPDRIVRRRRDGVLVRP